MSDEAALRYLGDRIRHPSRLLRRLSQQSDAVAASTTNAAAGAGRIASACHDADSFQNE